MKSCNSSSKRPPPDNPLGLNGAIRILYAHTVIRVAALTPLISALIEANPGVRGSVVVNVEQLKSSVNRMSVDVVREAVAELRLDGLVTEGKTPFNKLHFNTCFAEIEALFQRAGYHRQLDVVGYQGLLYALYDPGRWEAVDVLRWLKEYTEAAGRAQIPA